MFLRKHRVLRGYLKATTLLVVGVGGFIILIMGLGEFLPDFQFDHRNYDICECLSNTCR
jgi:hypothetical protein